MQASGNQEPSTAADHSRQSSSPCSEEKPFAYGPMGKGCFFAVAAGVAAGRGQQQPKPRAFLGTLKGVATLNPKRKE